VHAELLGKVAFGGKQLSFFQAACHNLRFDRAGDTLVSGFQGKLR
jgi:hypothetical protein